VYIAARKPALYAAALCSMLAVALSANAFTRNTVGPAEPEVRFVRYMEPSWTFTNEARLQRNADMAGERTDPPQLPPRPNRSAPCDLTATLPSGEAVCFFIQW
jgi:predicted component of type VI protein secretion system